MISCYFPTVYVTEKSLQLKLSWKRNWWWWSVGTKSINFTEINEWISPKPQSFADITNWINLFILEILNWFSSLSSFTFNSFISRNEGLFRLFDWLFISQILIQSSDTWNELFRENDREVGNFSLIQGWLMMNCPIQRTSLTTFDNYFRHFSSSVKTSPRFNDEKSTWMNIFLNYMIIFCGS